MHNNNKRWVESETNVLDDLHRGVGCQGLGNLLPCVVTEVVVRKAAETGEKMHRSAK